MSLFASWVERADPSAAAVADDGERLSYGELLARSRAQARALRRTHGAGRFVLIPAERSVRFVRTLLAASISGNVPVPIDAQAPERAVQEIARRCGDSVRLGLDAQPEEGEGPLPERDPALPELVIFTSGTSGTPKGVPMSAENLTHSARAVTGYLDYAGNPSAAVVLPLHYSYALLTQVLYMFYVGGTVRLFDNFRNPIKLANVVEAEGLRTFCGVPSTYHSLCALHRLTPLSMPSVRVLCSAGAAMDRQLLPTVKEIFPNARFFDNYGMTEATPRISYIRDDDPRFAEPTCGRPIDGLEVFVVDEQDLSAKAEGEEGILAIRGPSIVKGYLNDPESTRRAFRPDGAVLSGDIARISGGYIYLLGRRDEMLKVGGEKVSPLEIERALAEHDDVIASAVGGIDDPQRGQIPAAYVELKRPVDRQTLTEFLRARLAPVKVPVRYFEVRSFPLTPNGKLQRALLSPSDREHVIREIV